MIKIKCIKTLTDQNQLQYGCFLIEPLEIGQGVTLGNSLRRTLLSDLTGFTIKNVRINDLKHEFSPIEGLKEDCLEILLNIKEIILKEHLNNTSTKTLGILKKKGPIILNAGMIELDNKILKVLNPNKYIATILTKTDFYMEIDIEHTKNSFPIAQNHVIENSNSIFITNIFDTVKRVNFKVKINNNFQGKIKEILILEI
jgi:DNA-directed RNA polymerase subunit alpha